MCSGGVKMGRAASCFSARSIICWRPHRASTTKARKDEGAARTSAAGCARGRSVLVDGSMRGKGLEATRGLRYGGVGGRAKRRPRAGVCYWERDASGGGATNSNGFDEGWRPRGASTTRSAAGAGPCGAPAAGGVRRPQGPPLQMVGRGLGGSRVATGRASWGGRTDQGWRRRSKAASCCLARMPARTSQRR
jgi:hypothetical protein